MFFKINVVLFKCMYDINSMHDQKYMSIINYASQC